MTNEEKVKYWIDLSNRDFDTAEWVIKGGYNLHAGYMCHQAVEKILKGYFTKIKEDTPPFTHNLIDLAVKTELYDLMSNEQKIFVGALNPLNIETRYPEFTRKRATAHPSSDHLKQEKLKRKVFVYHTYLLLL